VRKIRKRCGGGIEKKIESGKKGGKKRAETGVRNAKGQMTKGLSKLDKPLDQDEPQTEAEKTHGTRKIIAKEAGCSTGTVAREKNSRCRREYYYEKRVDKSK